MPMQGDTPACTVVWRDDMETMSMATAEEWAKDREYARGYADGEASAMRYLKSWRRWNLIGNLVTWGVYALALYMVSK